MANLRWTAFQGWWRFLEKWDEEIRKLKDGKGANNGKKRKNRNNGTKGMKCKKGKGEEWVTFLTEATKAAVSQAKKSMELCHPSWGKLLQQRC